MVLQPDSDKIGAFERRPDGGGLRIWFSRADALNISTERRVRVDAA